ncbi:protein kinase-like domain-containing protein [Xylariomycetidae sp. FL0641]|nr:protein kinase-like domain-containing protein [Xylariomycetidae sp. FL0641]
MASYSNTVPVARPGQQAAYGAPVQMQMPMQMHAPSAPAGTFAPGTKIQVGDHRVMVQKYLSEGGFAHVYLVKLPKPIDGTDVAVLKRVAVPDKDTLRGMRTEVETMKRLKGHRPIVTYIDSHASELKGGGYEVFLLMEYCNGGGLIDFMNTRLQHRLTEPEILQIFSDIAEGVACMHYLKPPLLHRDLKVENVLINTHGSKKKFKLCDFGSAATPKPAPQTVVECRLVDEDVQRHTTMQYRSPEMIDVYRKLPIDEKSDIWALGVLLYKLCYYTTPFEDQGQLAILNASYKFPSYPVFSDRLKQLIASMLRENPRSRPNIYQVLRESCLMQGRDVPIHDIYSTRSQSEPRGKEKIVSPEPQGRGTPTMGAVYSPPPQQQVQALPEITPMRRGRPAAASQAAPAPAHNPSPSPMRITNGDPFAALDSKSAKKAAEDELASRFPTLDQFSLLHDQGAKFDFDSPTSPNPPGQSQQQPSQVVNDAFSMPQARQTPVPANRHSADLSRVKSAVAAVEIQEPSSSPAPVYTSASVPPRQPSRASAIISSNPELQAIASPPLQPQPDISSRPSMVSIGTMTNSPPPPEMQFRDYPPIHRFPPADQHRPSSLPRQQDVSSATQIREDILLPSRPSPGPRALSTQSHTVHTRQPSSSRPSLEGGRPSLESVGQLARSTSTSSRPRPASTYLESSIDYLREREAAPRPLRTPTPKVSPRIEPQDETTIESNVDFLRSMEDPEGKKKEKIVKNHTKRSSLGSLSGTKNMLAGRFGDAFKRFEGSNTGSSSRTPPPLIDTEPRELTPIAGSEATDGRSDDGQPNEPEMTPEMRRELEAQSLAEEERRVEAAAAEYKQRMAARGAEGSSAAFPKSIGGVSRAVSIQNRVQNLLDESQRSSQQVQRTAEGYGKFSDEAVASSRPEKQLPEVPRKPTGNSRPVVPVKPASSSSEALARVRTGASTQSSSSGRPIPPAKPSSASKPAHLANLPTGSSGGNSIRPRSPPKQALRSPGPAAEQHLVAVDLPGQPALDMSFQEKEDYIQDFSKRFPSLGAIEMVEREIDSPQSGEGASAARKGGR